MDLTTPNPAAADPATGARPANPWRLADLMRAMARVPARHDRFVEHKTVGLLDRPLTLTGTLRYARPDQVEKHVLTPTEERYAVAGDRLTVENPAKNRSLRLRLGDYPVIWAFAESIRATLAGDLPALRRFYRAEFSGGRDDWTLRLIPYDEDMARYVRGIALRGAGDRVTEIRIEETDGDRSVMRVTAGDAG